MTTRTRTRPLARAARRAFSLLEITLVLVIIGLLMGVAAVNLLGTTERARIRTTRASMANYKTNISTYMVNNANTLPPTLKTLVDAKYVEANNVGLPPQDAWDKDFYYQPAPDARNNPYQLISAGPDKEFGTPDDIDLWAPDQAQ